MRCFNRMLFPPPLRPMITIDSPVRTSRLTPSSTRVVPKLFFRSRTSSIRKQSVQEKREKKIADQNRNRRENDCFRRSSPHAFGAFAAVHSFVAPDNRQDKRKNHGLEYSSQGIGG